VERSADGKNFQPLAVFLNGEIAVSDYRYTDQSGTTPTLYYRLKMKDDKGETRYSNILSFAAADAAPAAPLQVYPSVVRDHFTARVSSTGAAAASLQVVNYAGQTVYTSQLNLQAGENNISVNNFNKASGNYIVLIRTAGQSYTQKIVVQ